MPSSAGLSSIKLPSVSFVVTRFLRDEEGATLVEYVLLVALIAAVAIGAITLLGTSANAKLGAAASALQ